MIEGRAAVLGAGVLAQVLLRVDYPTLHGRMSRWALRVIYSRDTTGATFGCPANGTNREFCTR